MSNRLYYRGDSGIKIFYSSIDHYSETRRFKTIAGAQKYAHHTIGAHPEMGFGYAVSGDGVGKITCTGISLRELFPDDGPTPGAMV